MATGCSARNLDAPSPGAASRPSCPRIKQHETTVKISDLSALSNCDLSGALLVFDAIPGVTDNAMVPDIGDKVGGAGNQEITIANLGAPKGVAGKVIFTGREPQYFGATEALKEFR